MNLLLALDPVTPFSDDLQHLCSIKTFSLTTPILASVVAHVHGVVGKSVVLYLLLCSFQQDTTCGCVSLFSLFPSSKKLLHFSVAPHHHHAEVLRPHVRVTFTDECFLCVSVCCLQVRVGRRALGLDWGEEQKIESIHIRSKQERERERVRENYSIMLFSC